MTDKGIQQKDLAEKCGISSNGISTWKTTGTIPRADIAIKIARFLNVSVEYLITGELTGIEKKDSLAYTVAALSENKRRVVQAVVDSLSVFD